MEVVYIMTGCQWHFNLIFIIYVATQIFLSQLWVSPGSNVNSDPKRKFRNGRSTLDSGPRDGKWSHDFRGVWIEPFDTTVKISFVRQNAFWNVFNEFHFLLWEIACSEIPFLIWIFQKFSIDKDSWALTYGRTRI